MSNGHVSTSHRPDIPTVSSEKILGPARSGRWFVIGAVVSILVIWGTLFLVFRDWRVRHRELAEFGAREVATTVDLLADRVPPNVSPKAWSAAVADTHAMLVTLTGSGQLDRADMEALRDDLRARFAKTTPATAVRDLSALWDEMQLKAGPILLNRSSRPPFCPPRPKLLGGRGD